MGSNWRRPEWSNHPIPESLSGKTVSACQGPNVKWPPHQTVQMPKSQARSTAAAKGEPQSGPYVDEQVQHVPHPEQ